MPPPTISVAVVQGWPRGYLGSALESVDGAVARLGSAVERVAVLGGPDPEGARMLAAEHPEWAVAGPVDAPMGRSVGRGIRSTHGEVLCFLDDDDRFLPGKLVHVAERFAADPTLSYLHHEVELIDPAGHPIHYPGFRSHVRGVMRPGRVIDLPAGAKRTQLGRLAKAGADFNTSSMVVRRSAVEPFLPWIERAEAGIDALLFFIAALAAPGAIRCEGDRWTQYRLHAGNVSWSGGGPGARAALAGASLRQAEGQQLLIELGHSLGDPELERIAGAIVEGHRFFATLRSPHPSRRQSLRAITQIAPYLTAFPVRPLWPAIAGSLAMLVAPRAAQKVYLERIAEGADPPSGPPV